MSDHPTTYNAEAAEGGIAWDDRAEIHMNNDGRGLLDGAKGIHDGSFLEMVRLMMAMTPEERHDHVIQKLGDRMFSSSEVEAIAARSDYPG
tara:strand:+ start:346 stop:618 length:273 start_codon:yes stop_codon:yes gene_type:complete